MIGAAILSTSVNSSDNMIFSMPSRTAFSASSFMRAKVNFKDVPLGSEPISLIGNVQSMVRTFLGPTRTLNFSSMPEVITGLSKTNISFV